VLGLAARHYRRKAVR